VTLNGQIRIHFKPTNSEDAAVTGIGTMQLVNHAWRITMQMPSSGTAKVIHSAYMMKVRLFRRRCCNPRIIQARDVGCSARGGCSTTLPASKESFESLATAKLLPGPSPRAVKFFGCRLGDTRVQLIPDLEV
jgi:hypothetical protein